MDLLDERLKKINKKNKLPLILSIIFLGLTIIFFGWAFYIQKSIKDDNISLHEMIASGSNEENKIVAAICAAPIALAKAGVIEGKKVTSYPGFKDELGNVNYVEEDTVVVDGNIITSRGPATALVFGLEILKKLGYEKEAEEIREGMLINFFLEKEGK